MVNMDGMGRWIREAGAEHNTGGAFLGAVGHACASELAGSAGSRSRLGPMVKLTSSELASGA